MAPMDTGAGDHPGVQGSLWVSLQVLINSVSQGSEAMVLAGAVWGQGLSPSPRDHRSVLISSAACEFTGSMINVKFLI